MMEPAVVEELATLPDRARDPASPWSMVRPALRRTRTRRPVRRRSAAAWTSSRWGISLGVRVEVEHAERLPRVGGALLVSNRGLGVFEPAALAVGVRKVIGRRIRVIGAPSVPVVGDLLRKLGALGPTRATSPRCCAPATWPPRPSAIDVAAHRRRGAAARSARRHRSASP